MISWRTACLSSNAFFNKLSILYFCVLLLFLLLAFWSRASNLVMIHQRGMWILVMFPPVLILLRSVPVWVCSVSDPTVARCLLTHWPAPISPAAPPQALAGTAAARNTATQPKPTVNCQNNMSLPRSFWEDGLSVPGSITGCSPAGTRGTTHAELYSCSSLNYTTPAIICLMKLITAVCVDKSVCLTRPNNERKLESKCEAEVCAEDVKTSSFLLIIKKWWNFLQHTRLDKYNTWLCYTVTLLHPFILKMIVIVTMMQGFMVMQILLNEQQEIWLNHTGNSIMVIM